MRSSLIPLTIVSLITLGGTSAAEPTRAERAQQYVDAAIKYAAEGESEFSQKMLTEALQLAPDHPVANSMSGRVNVGGEWVDIPTLQAGAKTDERQQEYERLRKEVGFDLKRLAKLARWCVRNEYSQRAALHYRQLLAHPSVDASMTKEAIKALDLRVLGGGLVTKEQVDAFNEQNERHQSASRKYKKILLTYQRLIDRTTGAKQEEALASLQAIDDPDVALIVHDFVATSGQPFGTAMLALLAKFDQEDAINAEILFAVGSRVDAVQDAAINALRKRDTYSYVPKLLDSLLVPVESQWKVVRGPDSTIRYEHSIVRRGEDEDVVLTEANNVAPQAVVHEVESTGNRTIVGLKSNEEHEFKQRVIVAQAMATAGQREKQINEYNQFVLANNDPLYDVLEGTMKLHHKRYPQSWWDWWNEYTQSEKTRRPNYTYRPVQHEYDVDILVQRYEQNCEKQQGAPVPRIARRRSLQNRFSNLGLQNSRSGLDLQNAQARGRNLSTKKQPTQAGLMYSRPLFIPRNAYNRVPFRIGQRYPEAGVVWRPAEYEKKTGNGLSAKTVVWTEKGLKAIQDIQSGDRVFSRDPATGSLTVSVVQSRLELMGKSNILNLDVGGASVALSKGTTVWHSATGWQISDSIIEGAPLTCIRSSEIVELKAENEVPELLYHLVVEDQHAFFVGEVGMLVHDATKRRAINRKAQGAEASTPAPLQSTE